MRSEDYIGTMVSVVVDRPLGSKHPEFGFPYPVNYGFIARTKSSDGEELDAYVLAVSRPVDEFHGECIACIQRKEESDDKLVIVPPGVRLSEAEIRAQVQFQEHYFQTTIISKG